MKKLIVLCYLALQTSLAFSQLNTGQWLTGGNALFMYQNNAESRISSFTYQLSPDVGYFITDNFALGIRGYYSLSQITYSYSNIYVNAYDFKTALTDIKGGLFLRYYILPKTFKVNVFADVAYSYGYMESKSESGSYSSLSARKTNNLNFGVGPAFMLNTHVSLMLLLNYQYVTFIGANSKRNDFTAGVGFQIHLGKGKE